MDFAQLHNHTEYSQLDGMGTCDQYAKRAKKLGMKYLGITDHGTIDGLIKFQKSCKKHDIKPVLGCELYVVPKVEKEKTRGHMCVWVKNSTGFKNLTKLLTFANKEGFYYKPRVSFDYFLENCEGLVVSTACLISFARIYNDLGEQFYSDIYDTIGDDLYSEIMPHPLLKQRHWNIDAIAMARRHGLKTIMTNDCHYVRRLDYKAQDVLLAIQRKDTMDNPDRFRFTIRDLHLRTGDEMLRAFRKYKHPAKREFLQSTIEIAEKCSGYTIPQLPIALPRVPGVPINPVKAKAFLLQLCHDRYEHLFGKSIQRNKVYMERLNEEFALITKKKFERYFFMVWEVINWCKENDILVGPGRGSVGGSLMAYLLGITAVDPIEHNLLFSRFINEDRIDYPDIDIDFEDRKRHLVRQHLETIYGIDKVAGVSSFNRMKAKAVVKDVGRAFGVHWSETDVVTKLIEDNDEHTGIEDAIDSYSEAQDYKRKYPKVIKFAQSLEGQVRGYGQHAAALVISKEPIGVSGRCNLRIQEGHPIVNWEKEDTEYVGLMKLDALGLKLLSILSETKRLIKENLNRDIDFEKINTNDKAVFKDISAGRTVGVFQLGTYAMTSLIKEMGIETFKHMSDAVALVRPGPANSGMTAEYIRRKHGGDWEPMHEIYEEITKDTYGLLVYQEQVMQTVSAMADLPYSTSDKIRKIIGKKRDVKEFEQYKAKFVAGCKKTGYFSSNEAIRFWDGLEKWSKYGFNRSHSVEYAMLAYWCSWLKRYYPVEFICASLTYGAENKKKEVIEEAYKLGLQVMLPTVGRSDAFEWRAVEGRLYIPFIEVKGIGEVKAKEAASGKPSNSGNIKGFFKKTEDDGHGRIGGKFGELLNSLGAYEEKNPELTADLKALFKFRIVTNPRTEYRKLYELFDHQINLSQLDGILEGDEATIKEILGRNKLIHQQRIPKTEYRRLNRDIAQCIECDLIEECKAPVAPSPGHFNVAIIGEVPGRPEDEQRMGFVGRTGDEIWKSLRPFPRRYFHLTHFTKCFPMQSKKPKVEQIQLCSSTYLDRELSMIQPTVILAFGNAGLQFFRQQKSGIMGMSGKVYWSERYSAWVVYCLHPAAMLHNPDNKAFYLAGMKRFKKLVKALGLPIAKR